MAPGDRLVYPQSDKGPGYALTPLGPEIADDTAHAALSLLTRSYAAVLENGELYPGSLPAGSVQAHFDPEDDTKVSAYRERMHDYLLKGSRYFAITQVGGRIALTDGGAIAGLVKFSPSQSRLARLRGGKPNIFVNDIVADSKIMQLPNRPGLAAGATLMHAALAHGGYDPVGVVALHGFVGASQNAWYRRLGFKAAGAVKPMPIGQYEVPQMLFSSEGGKRTIADVISTLEARHPQLYYGTMMPAGSLIEPYET